MLEDYVLARSRLIVNPHPPMRWVHTNRTTAFVTMSGATKYQQDGEEAREIAKYLPYFPFKGIDRFYDIGGFLYNPEVFQRIVDIFADRYREIGIDVVAG